MGTWNDNFRTETWTEYAFGIAFIVLRLVARARKLGGVRNWQIDDWIAFQTIFWYTLLIVSLNKVVFGGGSNFMSSDELAALTPETKAERINGSKWVLVSEEAMIMAIWSCKVCMVIIYRRLTAGLKQARLINGVAVFVGCGFVGTQVALFAGCRPFWGYWSVLAISTQCWSYWNYEYIEGAFNVTADVTMLLVAIPLIAKVRLPWAQKAPILGIFGMGIFVITSAVLTKVYCFVPSLLSYEYLAWYCREATMSIYVTMLPPIWSYLRNVFPALRHWGYKTPTNSRNTSQPSTTPNGGSGHRLASFNTQSFNRIHSVDLKGVTSEEHISPSSSLQINKDVTFAVEGDVTEEPVHSSQARPTVHGFLDGYNGTSTAFVSAA